MQARMDAGACSIDEKPRWRCAIRRAVFSDAGIDFCSLIVLPQAERFKPLAAVIFRRPCDETQLSRCIGEPECCVFFIVIVPTRRIPFFAATPGHHIPGSSTKNTIQGEEYYLLTLCHIRLGSSIPAAERQVYLTPVAPPTESDVRVLISHSPPNTG